MINNFLIISCTGKNNFLGLKLDNKFFSEKIQNNIYTNNSLVNNIMKFLAKNNAKLNKEYSIIFNQGPGSFSSLRIALSVAKGIQIVYGIKIYGYKNSQLEEFKLENIENLLKNNKLEEKKIKPIYQN